MPPPLAFELAAFALGLLLGSFLNVCISRLPHHHSISKPRSHCPNCKATIRWYDNIPLLSWILLRARCRHCKQQISWRYPAVELAVGFHFLLLAGALMHVMQLPSKVVELLHEGGVKGVIPLEHIPLAPSVLIVISTAILGFLLIGLMVMDWQSHTLPDAFTLTGIAIGFALVCCQAVFLGPHQDELLLHGRNPLTSPGNVTDRGNVILTGPEHLVLGRLLAIVAAAGTLLLIRFLYQRLRHREGLGLGDVKLIGMIAAFLGFWAAVVAFFLGIVLCAGYALILMLRSRATAVTRLPLGSFLCLGGIVAMLYGDQIVTWYTSLLSTSAVLHGS